MKNKLFIRFFATFFIFGFISFVCPIISFSHDIEKGVNDTVYWANDAYGKFDTEKDDYIIYYADLIVLEAERAALTVSYNSNKSTMRKEAAKLASDAIPTSFAIWGNIKETATNASIIVITASDDLDLKKALVKKTIEIQKKKVDIAAQLELVDDTYDHYIAHVDAYNKSKWNSPTTKSDDMTPTKKGKIVKDEIGVDTNLSVKCSNPKCNTVYTVGNVHPANSVKKITLDNVIGLSEGHHLVSCQYGHAIWMGDFSNVSNQKELRAPDPYWDCPNDPGECPKIIYHKEPCRGGCGTHFAREVGSPWAADYSHRTDCNERIPESYVKLFGKSNKLVDCPGRYYNCNGQTSSTCYYSKAHADGDETASTPSPPSTPSTPTPTPTYHACGVHETTVAGDHSLQASCSKTDSHGQSCTVSGFYACASHTCVFPTVVDNTPNCSACTNGCSSCPVTCAAGHVYDPSKAKQVSKHKTRTCKFCSQTWQKCVTSAPKCRDPKRKKQNRSCWAAED